ncbi:Uncharacterised protein [Janthinobacterium lividum]|uniref:hypothetical protein n=1 Tax=Janthinobacterium lividum TaxID=29581 RepID=UPI000DFE2E33|nr:hypothetical protein [Janthinobacterium lividum]STR27819.1 Uncharacterised protein [Janthinobacterium lividum]
MQSILKFVIALNFFASTAGCSVTFKKLDANLVSVESVVKRIKDDIATYNFYFEDHLNDAPVGKCFSTISFYIDSVTVTLITKEDKSKSDSAGIVIPIGMASLSGNYNSTYDLKNSRTLKFTMFKRNTQDSKNIFMREATPIDPHTATLEEFPITTSLRNLREGLLAASVNSQNGTCLALSRDDSKGNNLEFSILAANKSGRDGGIKFAIFSSGVSNVQERAVGNTISVTFMAVPGSLLTQ